MCKENIEIDKDFTKQLVSFVYTISWNFRAKRERFLDFSGLPSDWSNRCIDRDFCNRVATDMTYVYSSCDV